MDLIDREGKKKKTQRHWVRVNEREKDNIDVPTEAV